MAGCTVFSGAVCSCKSLSPSSPTRRFHLASFYSCYFSHAKFPAFYNFSILAKVQLEDATFTSMRIHNE